MRKQGGQAPESPITPRGVPTVIAVRRGRLRLLSAKPRRRGGRGHALDGERSERRCVDWVGRWWWLLKR